MRTSMMVTALAATGMLSLAGCGGDGGAPAATTTAAKSGGAPQNALVRTHASFAEASVHDPSVIRANGQYYVFGSHLAAAKTPDLMHWTKIADGVTAANPLIPNVANQLAEALAWAQTSTL